MRLAGTTHTHTHTYNAPHKLEGCQLGIIILSVSMATGPQSECLRLWEDLGFSFDVAKSYAPESEFRGGGGGRFQAALT